MSPYLRYGLTIRCKFFSEELLTIRVERRKMQFLMRRFTFLDARSWLLVFWDSARAVGWAGSLLVGSCSLGFFWKRATRRSTFLSIAMKGWRPYFAWRPMRVDGRMVWLVLIDRRQVRIGQFSAGWEYRLPKDH